MKFVKPLRRENSLPSRFLWMPCYFGSNSLALELSFGRCHFWVRGKKGKGVGKKGGDAGKELPEVLKMVQKTVEIDCGRSAIQVATA